MIIHTAPSNHPLNLRVVAFQPPLITFEWEETDMYSEQGESIIGYEVRFYSNASYITHFIDDVSINSYTVQDADPTTTLYGLSIAFVSASGVGCHSPIILADLTPEIEMVAVNLLRDTGW